MDVEEFVKDVLVQICKGVKSAQKEISAVGGSVNPTLSQAPDSAVTGFVGNLKKGRGVYLAEFDIAITASDEIKAEGGGKIKVFDFASIGRDISKSGITAATSRVKFRIPLAPPADESTYSVPQAAPMKRF